MVKKRRSSYQRLERNIYIDQRNGSFRFRVAVHYKFIRTLARVGFEYLSLQSTFQ